MSKVATAVVGASIVQKALFGDNGAGDANRAGGRAADAQARLADKQGQISQEQWDQYKSIYQPLETAQAADAVRAGGIDDQNAAVGLAAADVEQSYANQAGQMDRSLSRSGVAPGSGAALALRNDMALEKAANSAGAMTRARSDAVNVGRALRTNAINTGRGISSGAMTGLSNAGNMQGNVASTYGGMGAIAAQRNQDQAGVIGAGITAGLNYAVKPKQNARTMQ